MRLIVHIGAGKCGSSALQWIFVVNAATLRANGVLIPGKALDTTSTIEGQQVTFFEGLRPIGSDEHLEFLRRLMELKDHAQGNNLGTIVISGENLLNPVAFHTLFADTEAYFDVEVVAYIRRQVDFIISAWPQWYLKEGMSFPEFLVMYGRSIGNLGVLLEPWVAVLGRSRIRVRVFGGGDVVDDFLAATRLPSAGCSRSVGLVIRSCDVALVRIASRVPGMFADVHDRGFYDAMLFAVGEPCYKTTKGSSLLTLEQRQEILESYRPCNEELKAKYFAQLGADEPLFVPPNAADIHQLTDAQKHDAELATLIRAVYGLGSKVKALEESQANLSNEYFSVRAARAAAPPGHSAELAKKSEQIE